VAAEINPTFAYRLFGWLATLTSMVRESQTLGDEDDLFLDRSSNRPPRHSTGYLSARGVERSPAQGAVSGHPQLDETDRRIVRALHADGRMSMRDLAQQVHVSRASVYTRVNRLLNEGVIQAFTIRVDPERAGLGTSAYITLRLEQNAWREIRDRLLALPPVEHVALLSGDFDALLLVRVASNRELRDLVFGQIQSMPGVRSATTLLIFDETEHLPALPH
jgi:DNA-binding Lrp family transcriptional regulator